MQEGRFSFGCCIRTNKNGVEQGVRCKPFDYSGKKILGICMYKDMIEDETKSVIGLSAEERKKQKWIEKIERDEGQLWEEDPLNFVKGIGPATMLKMARAGVLTVKELAQLSDDDIVCVSNETRISKNRIQDWKGQFCTAQ
jgi:predicted flap endonuclease-1-like 5' DNA nuclease